jgi:hypothetical protein
MVPVGMAAVPLRESWTVAAAVRAMLARQSTPQVQSQITVLPETVGTA